MLQGLGVEPIGLSHVLSARGLDRLDAEVQRARARRWPRTRPPSASSGSASSSPTFPRGGGYTAEGEVSRLAAGLGLREELLLEDLASLSGGQRRRVDLMRVLYQRTPTSSCSTSPRTTSTGPPSGGCSPSSPALRGSLLLDQPRPRPARRVHRQGAHAAPTAGHRVQGQLLGVPAPVGRGARARPGVGASGGGRDPAAQGVRRRPAPLDRGPGAQGQDRGPQGRPPRGHPAPWCGPTERSTASGCPAPPRSGTTCSRCRACDVAYDRNVVLTSTSTPRRPRRPDPLVVGPQRRGQVEPAPVPRGRPGPDVPGPCGSGRTSSWRLRPGARAADRSHRAPSTWPTPRS